MRVRRSLGLAVHMASLQLYDVSTAPEGLDVERVRELYLQLLPLLPVFRQHLMKVPAGLDRPVWVEDRDVDVAAHVRGFECRRREQTSNSPS